MLRKNDAVDGSWCVWIWPHRPSAEVPSALFCIVFNVPVRDDCHAELGINMVVATDGSAAPSRNGQRFDRTTRKSYGCPETRSTEHPNATPLHERKSWPFSLETTLEPVLRQAAGKPLLITCGEPHVSSSDHSAYSSIPAKLLP